MFQVNILKELIVTILLIKHINNQIYIILLSALFTTVSFALKLNHVNKKCKNNCVFFSFLNVNDVMFL